jgi:Rrf2 family protein
METDYALRCMLLLSLKPEEIFGASKISEDRQIPRPFLTKILQKLARAGLVVSIRGSKGGFKLSRHPRKIYVIEIIEAMEGAIAISRCAIDLKNCNFSSTCALCPVWVEIRAIVVDKLSGWSLENLLISNGQTTNPKVN